jgi:hypothetical protein
MNNGMSGEAQSAGLRVAISFNSKRWKNCIDRSPGSSKESAKCLTLRM